jgi:MOB kinase activator 1
MTTGGIFSGLFGNRNRTFKPLKNHPKNGKRHKLSEYAKATLGSGNMRSAVVLPKGEDLNEWLAVNTVDFFNEISLLYGTITEFCTPSTCSVMSAGPQYEYLWADGVKVKKPIKVSAPEYVDLLMSWVETQLNDEHIFPLQLGTPFPKNFQAIVRVIFKRLFRVYAHIYHSHFQKIVGLGAEAHLNTCFKHFIYFVHEFKLIDPKELQPLKDLIDSLMGKEKEVKREDRPDKKSKKKKEGEEKKGSPEAGEGGAGGAEKEKEKPPEKEKAKEGGDKPIPATVPATAPPTTKAPG